MIKQLKATLISKKYVSEDVCHLFFSFDDNEFTFIPGQYAILNVPSTPTQLKRLYSFANSGTERNVFELLLKIIPGGAASEYVKVLSVGSSVDISGPAGLFRLQDNEKRKIFMATGTGIAPIRSFLLSKTSQSLNSLLFWGLKDFGSSYLADELLSLKKASSSFDFYYCLSKQSTFDGLSEQIRGHLKSGHIDAVLETVVPAILPSDEYYLCGSRTVIESLRTLLLSRGVEKGNLFFEKY